MVEMRNYCPCAAPENGCGRDSLRRLRETDFAIIDANLYLNVYPDCAMAAEYLEKLRRERAVQLAECEKKNGALTIFGQGRAANPAPWKYEAN